MYISSLKMQLKTLFGLHISVLDATINSMYMFCNLPSSGLIWECACTSAVDHIVNLKPKIDKLLLTSIAAM